MIEREYLSDNDLPTKSDSIKKSRLNNKLSKRKEKQTYISAYKIKESHSGERKENSISNSKKSNSSKDMINAIFESDEDIHDED